MQPNRASHTAYRVALSRAAHQLLDKPVVFADPVALQIVGAQGLSAIQSGAPQFGSAMARRLRAYLAARSRVCDDELALAVQHGVRQYVILGAGLDTFAYRNPYVKARLKVFEVDHPATQAYKRQQLHDCAIKPPAGLHFVAVDFETQSLDTQLRAAGWHADAPTFFSWLGVSMYLSPALVMATLAYVADHCGQGGGIVLDYITPLAQQSLRQRLRTRVLMLIMAALGEPWKGFFAPESLQRDLRSMGFDTVHDLGADALNARYFQHRSDALAFEGPGRVLVARK